MFAGNTMSYSKLRILGYFARSADHVETVGFYTTFFIPSEEAREGRESVRRLLDQRMSRHGLAVVTSGAFRTFCMIEAMVPVQFLHDAEPPHTDGFSLFRMRKRSSRAAMQAAWYRRWRPGLVLR